MGKSNRSPTKHMEDVSRQNEAFRRVDSKRAANRNGEKRRSQLPNPKTRGSIRYVPLNQTFEAFYKLSFLSYLLI